MFNRIFDSTTSSLSSPASWLVDWFRGGPEADSGVVVDVYSALGFAPIWYSVSTIAGHVGMLPWNVHRKIDGGSEIADTHPLQKLLKYRPNEYQTPIAFKEQMMVHALLSGNGRAAIIKRGGVATELLPMLPSCTYTCLVEGKKWHVVECQEDDMLLRTSRRYGVEPKSKYYKIPDSDVFHIPGLGYDGIAGKSLISVAKDSIGLGLAAQKAASRSFRNGGKPGVVIEAPPGAFRDPKDAKEFIDNFNTYHEGLDNTGRAALMREGMKLTTLAISSSDAEWVAQRKFQRQEIALLFGIQSMPGDEDSVSYSSLEMKNLSYLQNCLQKWLTKWEQEADWKLLGERSRRTHFTRFNEDALLRSDSKTRMETLSLGITSRIYSPNEARAYLDLLPVPGGDEFANPAITPGQAGESEQESTDTDTQESATPEDVSRRIVQSRIENLIGVESKHVIRAAKFAPDKNYLEWIDSFYAGKWLDKMREAIGSEAEAYCKQHYSELLEMTGMVTPDGLADAVAEVVTAWPKQAKQLTDQLLNKESCNV